MKTLNRRTLVQSAAAAAGISTFTVPSPGYAADPLQIGCVVPLTGPLNSSGQQYHYSLQMAQDDINAKGGIAGRKLEIVFADTRDSNAVAVNAFIKLNKDLNAPFMFLSSYTTQNLATEPEVAKAGLPVAYSGGGDAVQERKNRWMFRIRPNDAIAKLLLTDLNAKRPGLLYIQNDFGQGVARTVQRICTEAGSAPVVMESYGANDKDMSAQLLKFKGANADAVVLVSYGADGALIIRQVKQLGIGMPMVASSGVMVPAALNLVSADEVSQLYGMIDAFIDEGNQDATGDYARRFRARFGVKADPYGSCYYDAALMLKDAVEAYGLEREAIRTWFSTVKDWRGVTQAYTTDANGNMVHAVSIVRFKPGTTELAFVRTVAVS